MYAVIDGGIVPVGRVRVSAAEERWQMRAEATDTA